MTNRIGINMYRKGVGAVIINSAGKIFVGERRDVAGEWQMPQGGLDGDEELELAIFRELKEEVGTDKFEIIAKTDWLRYELPTDFRKNFWGGKYIGQEQVWFFLRFTGNDNDFNLNADSHPEFAQWQWVESSVVLERITEFKRDVYEQIIEFGRVNKIIV
ncbi:MAG: RNA pyrophosphohydrolase [Alphaproteobacteria bacterium]|nr:RNA pyrophosphohydrolase [Alphaproteobacteria bacterium]